MSGKKVTFQDFPTVSNNDTSQFLVGFSDKNLNGYKERKFAIKSIYFGEEGVYIQGNTSKKWYKLYINDQDGEDDATLSFGEPVVNPT